MPIHRLPVGRLTALVAAAVGLFFAVHGQGGPRFRTLEPGLEFATIRGEPYCRRGSSLIAVVRLDPAKVRLAVHHYTREPEKQPLDIVEWMRRTHARVVFNAGQYYPDLSYMGLLVSDGRVISRRPHPSYKAALVSEPVGGGRRARVVDLGRESLDPQTPGWKHVAQSFMLFDHSGAIRIRKSALIANRTVVAEDRDGRVLVLTTEGGYTLHDLATLLKDGPLSLSHAMSMDGGNEAELCVKTSGFRYASFGHWDGEEPARDAPGAWAALPAVITVEPR